MMTCFLALGSWHRCQPWENIQSAPSAGKQTTGGKREEEKAASAKRGKICSRWKQCQARVNTLQNPDWF